MQCIYKDGRKEGEGKDWVCLKTVFCFVNTQACLATGLITSATYCPHNYPGT